MPTPSETIATFLHRNEPGAGRRLEAAIAFADSMARELATAVAQWEEAAATLRRLELEPTPPRVK